MVHMCSHAVRYATMEMQCHIHKCTLLLSSNLFILNIFGRVLLKYFIRL